MCHTHKAELAKQSAQLERVSEKNKQLSTELMDKVCLYMLQKSTLFNCWLL